MPKNLLFFPFFFFCCSSNSFLKISANFLVLKDFRFFSNLEPVALVTLRRLSHLKLSQLATVAACWNDGAIGGNQRLKNEVNRQGERSLRHVFCL